MKVTLNLNSFFEVDVPEVDVPEGDKPGHTIDQVLDAFSVTIKPDDRAITLSFNGFEIYDFGFSITSADITDETDH